MLKQIFGATAVAVALFSAQAATVLAAPHQLTVNPKGTATLTEPLVRLPGAKMNIKYEPFQAPGTAGKAKIIHYTFGIKSKTDQNAFDALTVQTKVISFNLAKSSSIETNVRIDSACTADKYVACGIIVEAYTLPLDPHGFLNIPARYWAYYAPLKK